MLGMLAGILAVVEDAARMMAVAARRMAEVHAAADTVPTPTRGAGCKRHNIAAVAARIAQPPEGQKLASLMRHLTLGHLAEAASSVLGHGRPMPMSSRSTTGWRHARRVRRRAHA